MPSIMTLEGASFVNGNFQPRILSPSPGLQGLEFSATAANFWLGIGLGIAGTILVGRVKRGEPIFKTKSSSEVSGARGRRRRKGRR